MFFGEAGFEKDLEVFVSYLPGIHVAVPEVVSSTRKPLWSRSSELSNAGQVRVLGDSLCKSVRYSGDCEPYVTVRYVFRNVDFRHFESKWWDKTKV